MKCYTADELKEIIRLHALWLADADSGTRADLSCADLRSADLRSANLSGADLSSAYLSSAYLNGANLSGADLSGAYLSSADLNRADLSRAYLRGAYLSSANLSCANLSSADLNGAYLIGAYLIGADLSSADLSCADLNGAYLIGAYLNGADLSGAYLNRAGEISSMAVFSGLYNYQCWAVITEAGAPWVRMGCLFKSLEEWDSIGGIRPSNTREFPDDGSEKCERRVRAFAFTRDAAERMAAKWAAENPAKATD